MKAKFIFILVIILVSVLNAQHLSNKNYCVLIGTGVNTHSKISAPSIFLDRTALNKTNTMKYRIEFSGNPPSGARDALDYAVSIWSYLLNLNDLPDSLIIYANWKVITEANVVASASPRFQYEKFTDAEYSDTYYPVALAKAISPDYFLKTKNDVEINFNSTVQWYYGTDGNTPENKYDFVTAALHEITHGLGLYQSMTVVNGQGSWGTDSLGDFVTGGHQNIYDKFLVDENNNELTNLSIFANPSNLLGVRLTSGDIKFNGPLAVKANNGKMPKLWAPSVWDNGSSIAHLDDGTFGVGNSNSLLTHQIDCAEAIHSPGEVGLAILGDLGWKTNRVITVFSPTNGSVFQRGFGYQIKWTDNLGGTLVAQLYKNNGAGTYLPSDQIFSKIGSSGTDSCLWVIPASIDTGLYRIKMINNNGEGYGISLAFRISNKRKVETPHVYIANGRYVAPILVKPIVSFPSGATITYTIDFDSVDDLTPTATSSQVAGGLSIPYTGKILLKFRAFKEGYIDSDITTCYFTLVNGVTLRQVDENGVPFDSVAYCGSTIAPWKYVSYNKKADLIADSGWYFKSSQNFKSGTTQKFLEWTNGNKIVLDKYLNFAKIPIISENEIIEANFKTALNAQIRIALEGNPNSAEGKISFKDPWKIDYCDASKGWRNKGMKADMIEYDSPLIINCDNASFLGVHQNLYKNNGSYYYSVKAKSSISGKDGRDYHFSNWATDVNEAIVDSANELETPITFKNNGAKVYANYKGLHITNYSNVFLNPSQKKTKSDGANAILVYESMNSIWMESSANMGTSWSFLNGGKLINSPGIAKDPSIDGTDDADHFYLVGYSAPDASTNITQILAAEINGSTVTGTKTLISNIPGSTFDAQPVVACVNANGGQKAIMIWRQPAMEGFGGMQSAGLYYKIGTVMRQQDPVNPDLMINEISWESFDGGTYIEETDENSFNPTVAGNKSQGAIPMVVHLAYSQKSGDQSIIKYISLTLNNDETVSQSSPVEISDPIVEGYYYQLNEKPSITLVNDLPCVAWKNYNDATYMQSAVLRRKVSGSTWSDTYYYAGKDDDATSVHISNTGNMSFGYTNFVLGWNTSYSGDQFVKSTSLSTIYSSNTNGYGIQVMGGSRNDFNDSYLISFNNTSLPYSFTSSNAIPLGTLAKVTSDGEGRTIEERSGLIKLNNFFIRSSLGDLSFNGSRIDFKEPKDTLGNSLEHFSKSLETETIDVANSGILTYTAGFEYSDSLKALSFLKGGSHAGFSVELLDAETGSVLKKLNSFTLNSSSLKKELAQSYRLDLSGIGTRKVALRLSSELNLKDTTKAEYFVLRSYSVQRKARKNNFVDLNYSESARVTEYGLSQNYPNPFNPSTVINYQIPKASKVMLKVYDMLGKEVMTLVNEYKEMGRYSVEFNASSLPSGTYIYEIRANDFVKSGKMLLLK